MIEIEATGGPPAAIVLTVVIYACATGLSLVVAAMAYTGYRESGNRAQLVLAAGLVLLTTVPQTLRVILPTLTATTALERTVLTTASELCGLIAILYTIHGRPESRSRSGRRPKARREYSLGGLALLVGLVALVGSLPFGSAPTVPDEASLGVTALSALTAFAGSYVAWLAYSGYQRNESRPMLFLGLGIALITAVPFVLAYGVTLMVAASEVMVLLSVSVAQFAGVFAIYYSLARV